MRGEQLLGARADRWELGPRWRAAGLAASVVVALIAIVGLIGNRALAEATRQVTMGEFEEGRDAGRIAVRWAPWSAQAQRQLGFAEAGLGHKEQGRERLAKAAKMSPGDWCTWYGIGILSSGSHRRSAFVRAATLNPLQDEITAMRERGYRLPPVPECNFPTAWGWSALGLSWIAGLTLLLTSRATLGGRLELAFLTSLLLLQT